MNPILTILILFHGEIWLKDMLGAENWNATKLSNDAHNAVVALPDK